MDWQKDGAGWKPAPGNKLYVIDLTANPPALIDTVVVGKQPSGMAINRAGNLALIANRADNSISVLRISGRKVELIDTVQIGEHVAHVVFTPDGKRALAGKFPGHKVALLEVNGEKVTYTKQDITVGLWPYNLDVTPDGKLIRDGDFDHFYIFVQSPGAHDRGEIQAIGQWIKFGQYFTAKNALAAGTV
jgi:DNA-binding beta-propeller fold protein YncE